MVTSLTGRCFVTSIYEGQPLVDGTMSVWPHIGRATGADAISLRVLKFDQGISPAIRNDESDEILYVLQGSANVSLDGHSVSVEPETGIYLSPGHTIAIENPGPEPFVLISARCPEPPDEPKIVSENKIAPSPTISDPETFISRLADRKTLPTGDRWYRVLVDDEMGSAQVTQFVGSIPPGRAPDHFHEYEEVIFILRGEGRMWADEATTEISQGSCIYLPRRQVHCLENTGAGELRVLGVFYPAGSPAVRYDVE